MKLKVFVSVQVFVAINFQSQICFSCLWRFVAYLIMLYLLSEVEQIIICTELERSKEYCIEYV